MNTRRLTKKYKYKNRNKKTRRNRKSGRNGKTRRRVLKGGTINEETKIEVKNKFLHDFFLGLKHNDFPGALCALHTFYTCGIDISDINNVISSEEFKTAYAETFFKEVKILNDSGGVIINIEAKYKLIAFLSYIFEKIKEGETILCDDATSEPKLLYFTSGPDSFLKTLKKFFGYLDTACVLTISTIRSKYQLDEKDKGGAVLRKICKNLKLLAEKYPEMEKDITGLLGLMTTGSGKNMVYSFNTTNMCTLIKMTERLFTYFDEP